MGDTRGGGGPAPGWPGRGPDGRGGADGPADAVGGPAEAVGGLAEAAGDTGALAAGRRGASSSRRGRGGGLEPLDEITGRDGAAGGAGAAGCGGGAGLAGTPLEAAGASGGAAGSGWGPAAGCSPTLGGAVGGAAGRGGPCGGRGGPWLGRGGPWVGRGGPCVGRGMSPPGPAAPALRAGAFLPGLAGSSGDLSRVSPSRFALRRTRSAWGSTTLDEWLLTPMPSDSQRSRHSLFVSPSSLASSYTRMFPANGLFSPFVVSVRAVGEPRSHPLRRPRASTRVPGPGRCGDTPEAPAPLYPRATNVARTKWAASGFGTTLAEGGFRLLIGCPPGVGGCRRNGRTKVSGICARPLLLVLLP
jgi:hypothetical protein